MDSDSRMAKLEAALDEIQSDVRQTKYMVGGMVVVGAVVLLGGGTILWSLFWVVLLFGVPIAGVVYLGLMAFDKLPKTSVWKDGGEARLQEIVDEYAGQDDGMSSGTEE